MSAFTNTRIAFVAGTLAAAVLAGSAWAQSGDRFDRRVEIKNETGFRIVAFYASSVGQNSWEENILAGETIASGTSVIINIDDGTGYCKYDFRAVFEDGDVLEKGGVNVCEVATFTYN